MSTHRHWQAASYRHPVTGQLCTGKIHVLRDADPTRAVCGRDTTTMGGTVLDTSGEEGSTCTGCRKSISAAARHAATMAEWTAKAERENADWWAWYNSYLESPQWRALRSRVLARAGHLCEGCGQQPATQAHHVTYKRVGQEMLFDLVAICGACHDHIHAAAREHTVA